MSLYKEVPLSIQPFGYAVAAVTEAKHVCVSFDACLIHGVNYRASLHMYQWADGVWRLGTETQANVWTRELDATYLSRGVCEDPTPAARKALYGRVATAVVIALVKMDPLIFKLAQIRHCQREVESAQETVKKAQEVLRAAEDLEHAAQVALYEAEEAARAQD